ncbi:VF530 family protein [Pseudomonas sp. C11]|uniref:VF530 family protein n=1 Tax=Pseudomonas sp. C11 TaxID=3075550 RepID=UPI002AFF393C|nr:VF530 family protein [Pseudomonas sp. C11]
MHSNDPLHGLSLQAILTALVERIGWEDLARHVDVRCFKHEPSLKSSLTFLRKTPWARSKVEALYLQTFPRP